MGSKTTPKLLYFILSGLFVFASSCDAQHDAPQTIWSAEARSPDGSSLATARTVQYSGPGNAGLYTSVYLKRTVYSNPATQVLLFDENDVTQADSAKLNLVMKWETPSRLSVTYNGRVATLDFQVAKYAGIAITARDLSLPASSANGSN
jgi:hypothetical protein